MNRLINWGWIQKCITKADFSDGWGGNSRYLAPRYQHLTQCHTWWQMLGHDRGCGTVSTPHSPCYNQPCQLCINEVTNSSDLCCWDGFLQGIRPLLQAHFCLRGAETPVFLTSIENSRKVTLTELPNWEMSSFDSPATTSHAELFSWEKEWGNLAVIVQNN